jgi:glycosyltransferase involved in cell wall biosynthesis
MRVLYVIPSMGFGGAEVLLATQIPYLIEGGVQPIIVTAASDAPVLEAAKLPIKHISLGLRQASGRASALAWCIRLASRLRAVVRDVQPDLVHLNLYASDAWGRLASRGLARTVTTWHRTDLWMASKSLNDAARKQLERWTAGRADASIVAVSNEVKEWGCGHLGIPGAKVTVLYNGIDLARFPGVFPRRDNTVPRLVMVGRFWEQKGHDIALRALRIVANAGVKLEADFLGDGPLWKEMEALAQTLELGKTVNFLGARDDVPEILPRYDLFIMPSRYEGLPIAALEAMAAFVPMVATRVAGLSEVVEHERTGLLVPPEDPQALAEAIIRVLKDESMRREFAMAGRRRVETHFNLAVQVPRMVEYYRHICGE